MTPQPPKPVELKSCPFCGERPDFTHAPEEDGYDDEVCGTIECINESCISTWAPQPYEDMAHAWNARSEPVIYANRYALNYAQHARELLNDGEIENADGLLGTCIETLSAALTAAAIPQAEGAND